MVRYDTARSRSFLLTLKTVATGIDPTDGKSRRQAEAIIGDAVASVVRYAREVGKPIVIEQLDFRQKKAALEGESRKYSRMLSSFSYGKVKACFLSRGYRHGAEVH